MYINHCLWPKRIIIIGKYTIIILKWYCNLKFYLKWCVIFTNYIYKKATLFKFQLQAFVKNASISIHYLFKYNIYQDFLLCSRMYAASALKIKCYPILGWYEICFAPTFHATAQTMQSILTLIPTHFIWCTTYFKVPLMSPIWLC